MKKLIIGITLLSSMSVLANISKNCKGQIDNLILDHQDFESRVPKLLSQGELTDEDVNEIRKAQDSVVEMAALSCSIMRKVELQRSMLGTLGFISQKKVDKEGKTAHDETIYYYEENK